MEKGDYTRYDKMFRKIKKGKVEWCDVLIQIYVKLKLAYRNLRKF